MRKLLRRFCFRGFTLIELLVVISIIAILAAVLTPAVTDALTRGKMTGTMNNGRSIYLSLFAKDTEDPIFQTGSPYPKSAEMNNSVVFFEYVVTNKIMNVDFSFFSAPGITPCRSSNPADFDEENLAWCVTADCSDATPDGVPFLFTRNLTIDTTTEDKAGKLDANRTPYGSKGVVLVTKGGAGMVVKEENITKAFEGSTTNTVLRPAGAGTP